MMNRSAIYRWLLGITTYVVVSVVLVGCGNTNQQIEELNKALAQRRLDAATALADRLVIDPNYAQAGDIQLFISSSLTEKALKLFDNLSIEPSSMPGVKVIINKIRPSFSEGVASLNMDLTAIRGNLSMQVVGVATLLPEKLPDAIVKEKQALNFMGLTIPLFDRVYKQEQPLHFRVVVDRLEPKVSWGPFSAEIKGFLADFGKLKANEELNKVLPAIEVPLQNVIAIKQPPQTKPVNVADGKLEIELTTPAVAWSTTFSLAEVIVLPRGIHLIGKLRNPGAM
jgi:hypothetical protein